MIERTMFLILEIGQFMDRIHRAKTICLRLCSNHHEITACKLKFTSTYSLSSNTLMAMRNAQVNHDHDNDL